MKHANMNHTNSIGPMLKALRKSRGMTQQELSHKAGVSPSSISNIETGKQLLTSSNLVSITQALGYEARIRFIPNGKFEG